MYSFLGGVVVCVGLVKSRCLQSFYRRFIVLVV